MDYESINFCSKVRYTIVMAAAQLRKGAGAAAGRTLKIEYAASGKSRIERFMGYASKAEMLRIDMALLVSLALNVLSGNRSE